jgi:hypothetical protein
MKSCRWQQTAKRLITFGLSLVLIWGLIPVGNAEEYAELLPPEVVSYLEAASEAYGVPVETLIENGILDGVDLSAWLEYRKELQRHLSFAVAFFGMRSVSMDEILQIIHMTHLVESVLVGHLPTEMEHGVLTIRNQLQRHPVPTCIAFLAMFNLHTLYILP